MICTPLCCLLRPLSRAVTWPFRIFINLVLFYIILRSIFHLSVLVLLLLSSKGVHVPLLEYIDKGLSNLFLATPKDYENPSLINSLLMMLSSTLSLMLNIAKNLLLILGNGKAITGEIPYDTYNTAESTWKSIASDFIFGIHTAFVTVTDFIIAYCAKPFLYYDAANGNETNTIVSSAIHLVICGLLCIGIFVYNNYAQVSSPNDSVYYKRGHRKSSKRDPGDDSEESDNDSTGLKPIARSNRHIVQAFRNGYQSDDGNQQYYVLARRPRSFSGTKAQKHDE